MKAGTTSLFAYLAQHPEIVPCREKEPNFFSHHFAKGPDGYRALWPEDRGEEQVLLEASTSYAKYPSFPETRDRLTAFTKEQGIELKLIYVMRDPVARIESHHTYASSRWDARGLEEALGPDSHLVNVSRYAQQLDRYREVFDRGDLLLLDFDDLVGKSDEVLGRICAFLGIDAGYRFSGLDRPHNESRGARVVRPVEVLCARHPGLRKVAGAFPEGLRHTVRNALFRRRVEEKARLTREQDARVRDLLRDDMARLHKHYGVDVAKWGF